MDLSATGPSAQAPRSTGRTIGIVAATVVAMAVVVAGTLGIVTLRARDKEATTRTAPTPSASPPPPETTTPAVVTQSTPSAASMPASTPSGSQAPLASATPVGKPRGKQCLGHPRPGPSGAVAVPGTPASPNLDSRF